jgi:hypothetical protein
MRAATKNGRPAVELFRLDYLSCFLTVVATILVGRRMWTGLVVSCVNSLIVCVIGLHTSQYGFIPANVFCICINAYNLRGWLKVAEDSSESTVGVSSGLVARCRRMSHSIKMGTRRYSSAKQTDARKEADRMHMEWIKTNRQVFANVSGQGE